MHVYIYDSFVNQKKYDGLLARVETRITDLGLNGKISRLSLMTNLRDTISNEIRRGAKTIVVVGNDQTVSQAVNALAGKEIPLGVIPVGNDNNSIAAALGIDSEMAACDVLSARRIEKLDLGVVNNIFFLTKASITTVGSIVEINHDYSIETAERGEINIVNMETGAGGGRGKFNPQDGKLELYITTGAKKIFLKKNISQSVFTFKQLTIINAKHALILDGAARVTAPAEVSIAKQALNVIVGKGRRF